MTSLLVTHTELHSYTTTLSTAQTRSSSTTLDPKFTPAPKIHIPNLQIFSVQQFQDGVFLHSSNHLKHSIMLSSSSPRFASATFFSLLLRNAA